MGCKCCKIRRQIPHPDEKLQRTIDTVHLSQDDLSKLFDIFRKYDKDHSHTIDLDAFYEIIGERRSVFSDGIFDLIDADDTGRLNFSEYVVAIITFGLFEELEILKYCFFVFDKDKNGYIEQEEFDSLVDILWDHELTSNLKTAEDLTHKTMNPDGKIDFLELQDINKRFPYMLYPAFRMQRNLWHRVLGEKWWKEKQLELNLEREMERDRCNQLRIKEEKRLLAIKRRQMWRRYGNVTGCFYYACPWCCCQHTHMDAKILRQEEEGELTADKHTEEDPDARQKKAKEMFERLSAQYGEGFMRDPEILKKVNKHYNDRASLYKDGLPFRQNTRKERAKLRRDYRVQMAFT